jgi:hypothetical protein
MTKGQGRTVQKLYLEDIPWMFLFQFVATNQVREGQCKEETYFAVVRLCTKGRTRTYKKEQIAKNERNAAHAK